jgi:enoyl-CoA hydratase/carnithine racemase
MTYDFALIRVEVADRVLTASVDNPPINLIDLPLFGELHRLALQLEADEDVLVFVLKSANPDFFLAHFDVTAIQQFPIDGQAERKPDNVYHQMCERFRTMDKVTIAQIEGRVGGGGSELVSAFDMRFGVRGRTIVNQMEVPLGILPGGGGTQRLPRLLGRGRALEVILAGDDLDAETAERWGYLNRLFEPAQIGPRVAGLARRIAGFPPEAVRLAKAAVDCAARPLAEGLVEEAYLFDTLLRTDAAQTAMQRFLEVGGQTPEGEARVGALVAEIAKGSGA